jgi:hypothetical protein
MSMGPPVVHSVAAPAAATFSTAVDLGGSYRYYAIEIPTMTSATDIYIQGASTDGGTYRRIYFATEDSSPVVCQFPSSVTNGIYAIVGPLPRYVRTEYSSANTAAVPTIKFICHQ